MLSGTATVESAAGTVSNSVPWPKASTGTNSNNPKNLFN